MPTILREADCSQEPIHGWSVAVIGYGNQGRAQALNLRDAGYAVLVGARAGGKGAGRARAEGFPVLAPEEAGRQADLAAILAPDETHCALVGALAQGRAASRLRALVFAHGFALCFDPPVLDPAWDVFVVAPAGPGVQLRSLFTQGGGLPALFAVHQNGSGTAEQIGRAYAAAIGCARAGILATTVREETEVDLFGEQAVLCGGMNALTQAAFDTLVAAGYPDELAYLECVHQLRLTAELVERFGVEGMRQRISSTALFGDLTVGPRLIDSKVRTRLAEILGEVRSGAFARACLQTVSQDSAWAERELERARSERLERAGTVVRGLFTGSSGESGERR